MMRIVWGSIAAFIVFDLVWFFWPRRNVKVVSLDPQVKIYDAEYYPSTNKFYYTYLNPVSQALWNFQFGFNHFLHDVVGVFPSHTYFIHSKATATAHGPALVIYHCGRLDGLLVSPEGKRIGLGSKSERLRTNEFITIYWGQYLSNGCYHVKDFMATKSVAYVNVKAG